jgi:hypothetical protein
LNILGEHPKWYFFKHPLGPDGLCLVLVFLARNIMVLVFRGLGKPWPKLNVQSKRHMGASGKLLAS